MRIDCFARLARFESAEVWSRTEADFGLAEVVRRRLVGAGPARPRLPVEGTRLGWLSGPLAVRLPGGEIAEVPSGLFTAATTEALALALVRRYEPRMDRPVERELSEGRAAGLDEDQLADQVALALSSHEPRRAGRSWRPAPAVVLPHDDPREEDPWYDDRRDTLRLQWNVQRVERQDGPLLCAATPPDKPLALVRSFAVRVGGLDVPRCAFVLVLGGPEDPVVAWDGERMGLCQGIDWLPADLLEALDREGEARGRLGELPLGAPDLEPRFLVAVPPPETLEGVAERRPEGPAGREAALVWDSRAPVRLPPDLPVVSDPAEVRYVLARLNRGCVYLPEQPGGLGPRGAKAGCLVACRPGL